MARGLTAQQDTFLYAILIPVAPFVLENRFHVPERHIPTWTSALLAAYGGAFLVSAPILGIISGHRGRRRPLLWLGLLCMLASTAMLWAASSLALLITGRAVQGLSAAVVWVVGLAYVADVVEQDRVGQTMGYVCSGLYVSLALSPLLSGFIYQRSGYGVLYGVAFGVLAWDVLLRLALPEPPTSAPSPTRREETVLSPMHSPESTTSTESLGLKAGVPTLDRPHSPGPSLKTLLQSRSVWLAMGVTFAMNVVAGAGDANLPPFMVRTFGWSPRRIGLVMVAFYGPPCALSLPIGK